MQHQLFLTQPLIIHKVNLIKQQLKTAKGLVLTITQIFNTFVKLGKIPHLELKQGRIIIEILTLHSPSQISTLPISTQPISISRRPNK